MKKLLATLIISLSLAGSSYAIVGVGGQVGINFTHYKSNLINDNAQIGFHIGAAGRFGGVVYCHPMFNWQRTSTSIGSDDGFGNITYSSVNVHSFQVPVMVGVKAVDLDVFALRLEAGGYVNFAHNVKSGDPGFTSSFYNKWNAGTRFALGIDIFFITIDAFYDLGLTDSWQGVGSKERTIGVEAGVMFEF